MAFNCVNCISTVNAYDREDFGTILVASAVCKLSLFTTCSQPTKQLPKTEVSSYLRSFVNTSLCHYYTVWMHSLFDNSCRFYRLCNHSLYIFFMYVYIYYIQQSVCQLGVRLLVGSPAASWEFVCKLGGSPSPVGSPSCQLGVRLPVGSSSCQLGIRLSVGVRLPVWSPSAS